MTKARLYSLPAVLLLLGSLLLLAPAPARALTDFNGKPASLQDYVGKGKWVVVMIWASDCHICNKEAHAYEDFHFTHSDDDAIVLGISIDGKAKHDAAVGFIKRHKLTFPNLIGEPEEVARLFRELTGTPFVGTPAFLFYSPDGQLKAQQIGAVPTELIEEFIKQNTVASQP